MSEEIQGKDSCDICGKEAYLEKHPEGSSCAVCGRWICDFCADFNASDEDMVCVECAERADHQGENS